MTSAAKYIQDDGADGGAPNANVCAEAGRRCVKSIRQCQILSPEWLTLVDSFKQLCRLVTMEGRMSPNAKVTESVGRTTDGGTLWDQPEFENAIRILVEEAKVNLCLRLMNDFKTWQYGEQSRNDIRDTVQQLNYSEAIIEEQMRTFEESLGMLLGRAFTHVETLQLMDIPLLIDHCALVMNHAIHQEALSQQASGTKLQETIVIYYISYLMKHAEALNNNEVLARLKETNTIPMATRLVDKYYQSYPTEVMKVLAEGLTALTGNEDFGVDWRDFFPNHGDFTKFYELEAKVVAPLLGTEAVKQKDVRSLLDFFRKLERSNVLS